MVGEGLWWCGFPFSRSCVADLKRITENELAVGVNILSGLPPPPPALIFPFFAPSVFEFPTERGLRAKPGVGERRGGNG